MRFASTANGRPAWKRWHQKRRHARENYLYVEEATREEQVDFDIEEDPEDGLHPLALPGEMRDENYRVADPVSGRVYDYRGVHPDH